MLRLKIAGPTEYLAVTGQGIKDIRLTRKGWIWPWQKCIKFDLSPVNYTFEVQAMSAEKLPFILPAVFTIGPHTDDMESLYKYAKLMCNHDKTSNHVNDLVQGVIEGETRVLSAAMTMEEIFKGTKEFKEKVFEKVQLELNQFGMWIYNANVKQLVDVRGHEYFSYLGQKTQQEAANQAKIDTAEAMMKGEIGSKERSGQTAQNAAKIDADTKIYSTKRVGEGKKEEIKVNTEVKIFENLKAAEVAEANAELATKKAGWAQASQMAEVESAKFVALREAELQAEVEKKNAMTRTERLKADLLSKATVEYETKVQEANWDLYQKQKKTDASFYETMKATEAQRASADADFYVRQQAAEGELFAKMKEAEGELFAKTKEAEAIATLARAQGIYISTLLKAFGGNYVALRDYLMIDKKMFQEIAQINASAISGLQPKISIWNNRASSEEGNAGANGNGLTGIAGLYSMLPPLLQTVEQQTGMLPPDWLAKLPDASASSN